MAWARERPRPRCYHRGDGYVDTEFTGDGVEFLRVSELERAATATEEGGGTL